MFEGFALDMVELPEATLDAAIAHERLERHRVRGKLVLEVTATD
jgi:hypothetical protein